MYKHILKRPLYSIAGKISSLMRNFQKRQDDKLKQVANKQWNNLFNGKDFFEYNLYDYAKINLYKDSVLSRLIWNNFEKDETDYMCKVLKKGDVFVDIGSNIGLFSLIASKIVGNEGKVICFEPSPLTYTRLKENVTINNYNNLDVRNLGLSDSIGELAFYVSNNGYDAWNSFSPSADNKLELSIKVPVSTLDFELSDIDKSKIKLVKIDVEGWEKFVLQGAKDFLINFNPIVMVEFTEQNTFNSGYPVHEIYDIMNSYGYTWYRLQKGELVLEEKKLYYPYDNLVAIKNI
ncbi:FkbM family methyltransferase [Flavobacterium sp.]|uniref:FkbM family methyltransferase n=1 Tax=Flavobacterium sp. TaxID=239 RepID=UPI00391BE6AF